MLRLKLVLETEGAPCDTKQIWEKNVTKKLQRHTKQPLVTVLKVFAAIFVWQRAASWKLWIKEICFFVSFCVSSVFPTLCRDSKKTIVFNVWSCVFGPFKLALFVHRFIFLLSFHLFIYYVFFTLEATASRLEIIASLYIMLSFPFSSFPQVRHFRPGGIDLCCWGRYAQLPEWRSVRAPSFENKKR